MIAQKAGSREPKALGYIIQDPDRKLPIGTYAAIVKGEGRLRPRLDILHVQSYQCSFPFGTIATYLGPGRSGMTLVEIQGKGEVELPTAYLKEPDRLESWVDPVLFELGYCEGAESKWNGNELRRGEPTSANGLGFILGYVDAGRRNVRNFDHGPYNQIVRILIQLGGNS